MTEPHHVEPPEERLADVLDARSAGQTPARRAVVAALRTLRRLDRAAYRSVAGMATPVLDAPLRRLSHASNHSKPWLLLALLLAIVGGPRARRAAVTGSAAIAVTSVVVNVPMKLAGRRTRPDRGAAGVPETRWVPMPTSGSFPSGHSASAVAFAVAVGDVLPGTRAPLRAAAAVVALSRVYTGVHYPGDVAIGVTVGALIGRLTSLAGWRVYRERQRPSRPPP